jgi:pimeloyl-ACP methyl ester carboxylesterase
MCPRSADVPQVIDFHIDAGAQLAAKRWVAAGPLVFLLHAGVADRRSWDRVAPLLHRAGLDVVAYDRRGFGASRAGAEPCTHLGDLISLLDVVAGGEPVWLVGNSSGGGLALDAAVTEPQRFAGLVLLAPTISGAREPRPEELDPGTLELAERLATVTGEERLRAQTHLWLDGPNSREGRVGGPARELALEMARLVSASERPDDGGVEVWPVLEHIQHPVTVACGTLDVPAIGEQCRILARRVPRARHVTLEAVAHLPPIEAPERTARLVLDSMKSERGSLRANAAG